MFVVFYAMVVGLWRSRRSCRWRRCSCSRRCRCMVRVWKVYGEPKPAESPFPNPVWPLWFAPHSFLRDPPGRRPADPRDDRRRDRRLVTGRDRAGHRTVNPPAPKTGGIRGRPCTLPPSMSRRILIVSASMGAGHDGAANELRAPARAPGPRGRASSTSSTAARSASAGSSRSTLPAPAAHRAVELRPHLPPLVQAAVDVGLHRPPRHVRRGQAAAAGHQRDRRRRRRVDVSAVVARARQHAQEALAEGPGRSRTSPTSRSTRSGCTPHVDVHLATSPYAAATARTRGGDDARSPGPLVGDRFRPADAPDRAAARAELGLADDARGVLVVAGSWGVGDIPGTVDAIVAAGDFHPVVVCGRDEKLQAELDAHAGTAPSSAGATTCPRLMAACDVMVENAGGLTANEAFAVGLPVVTFLPIAGHGKDNAEGMAELGVTRYARTADELRDALEVADPARAASGPDRSRSRTALFVGRRGRRRARRGRAARARAASSEPIQMPKAPHRIRGRGGLDARALRAAHARRAGDRRARRRRRRAAEAGARPRVPRRPAHRRASSRARASAPGSTGCTRPRSSTRPTARDAGGADPAARRARDRRRQRRLGPGPAVPAAAGPDRRDLHHRPHPQDRRRSRSASSCPSAASTRSTSSSRRRRGQRLVQADHVIRPESVPHGLRDRAVYVLDGRGRDAGRWTAALADFQVELRPRRAHVRSAVRAAMKLRPRRRRRGRSGHRRGRRRWPCTPRRRWSRSRGSAATCRPALAGVGVPRPRRARPSTTDPTRRRRRSSSRRSTTSAGTRRSSCSATWRAARPASRPRSPPPVTRSRCTATGTARSCGSTPRRGRRRHRTRPRRGRRRHRRRSRSGSARRTARCRSAGCAARAAPGCARCSGPRGVATGAPRPRRRRWWTTCSTATSTAARCCCTTRTARRRPSAGTRRSARCPRSRRSSTPRSLRVGPVGEHGIPRPDRAAA